MVALFCDRACVPRIFCTHVGILACITAASEVSSALAPSRCLFRDPRRRAGRWQNLEPERRSTRQASKGTDFVYSLKFCVPNRLNMNVSGSEL